MALISKTVKTKPSGPSYKHYKELGYTWKSGEYIEVPIKDLLEGSNVIVEVECAVCEHHFFVPYYYYTRSVKLNKFKNDYSLITQF